MDDTAIGLASHPHLDEARQAGEFRLQRLVGQLPAIIWSTDRDRRLTSLHGAALSSLGLSVTKLIGIDLVALFEDEDAADGTINAHHRALRGEPTQYDLHWRERSWQVQVEPLRAADGSTIGTLGFAVDITARSLAEKALEQREAHQSLALAAASAATWEWDLETGEISRSQGMATLYGLPPGALEGVFDTHFRRIHPDDHGRIEEMDRQHLAEGRAYDVEYRVIWPDGSIHWLREKAQSVRDAEGRAIRLLGVTMEVTDRKAAEEAVHQSEARFRSLVQHAPDVIAVLDADGTIRYQSPAVRTVLGYAPEELIGTNAFSLAHPDDVPRAQSLFTELLRQPASSVRSEIRFRHQDGSWRCLEAIGTNLLDNPEVRGIVANLWDVTDRQRAEETLRENERHLRTLHAASQRQAQELALLDEVRTALAKEIELPALIRTVVEAIARTFGYTLVSLYLRDENALVLQHQVGYDRVLERISISEGVSGRVVRTGEPVLVEDVQTEPDFLGAIEGIISEVCVPLHDGGQVVGFLNLESTHGVTLTEADLQLMVALSEHVGIAIGRARLYDQVRRSEAHFRTLVQHGSDLVSIVDADGQRRYVSPSYIHVLGYHSHDLLGQPIETINHPDDTDVDRRFFAALAQRPGAVDRFEARVFHRDGSIRWLEAVASNRLDDPDIRGFVVNSRDITERKTLEDRLAHLAFHDPLTGLPNRTLFGRCLAETLERPRQGRKATAVLFVDLDGFKLVNDSYGHETGDRLLIEVGQRLRTCLRPIDTLARFGGDEFAILLDGVTKSEATRVAERLIAAVRGPFTLGNTETYVTASVGVALSARPRHRATDLLRNADIALYEAKALGRATYATFEPRMQARVVARMQRETALQRSLERGELCLSYQPIVELATGRIVGAEALMRWSHPEYGLLLPADFIGAAEDTGLIVPLGQWALREACHQAVGWLNRTADPPISVCVNLSSRQLDDERLVQDVAETLAESGLAAERLTLEITETVAMANAPETQRTLRGLRTLGVRLAIDDFGTGHSSLSQLRALAIDTIKIDGSFVAGLGQDRVSLAIVRAVSVLAHELGLEVTAEGVETADQVTQLRKLDVAFGQGFSFAPPLTAEAFRALLERGPCLAIDTNRADDTGGENARDNIDSAAVDGEGELSPGT